MSRGPIEIDAPLRGGNGTPPLGETTSRQNRRQPFGGSALALHSGATVQVFYDRVADCLANSEAVVGSYSTYRVMREHPTLALARAIVFAPIIASSWQLIYPKGTSQVWLDYVNKYILPLRQSAMQQALRSLDYGWQPFEKVWALRDGYYVLEKLKPLSQVGNSILVDHGGNLAGIRPSVGDEDQRVDLPLDKCWVYSSDPEGQDWYGRSRNENVRRFAWRKWLKTAARAEQLEDKISGIIPIIYHPPGSFTDIDGNEVTYAAAAESAILRLQRGGGITIEHMGFDADDIQKDPELLMASLIKVDFYDAGSYAAAQTGFVEALKYCDALIFRGWLRPEKSGMEGKYGDRAAAEAMGSVGALESEVTSDDMDISFCQQVLDDALVANFGESARGVIVLETPPLENRKAAAILRVLERLIGAGLGPAFARCLAGEEAMTAVDLPTNGNKFEVRDDEVRKPSGPGVKKPGSDDDDEDDDDDD